MITCKRLGVEPYTYLHDVLRRLPSHPNMGLPKGHVHCNLMSRTDTTDTTDMRDILTLSGERFAWLAKIGCQTNAARETCRCFDTICVEKSLRRRFYAEKRSRIVFKED